MYTLQARPGREAVRRPCTAEPKIVPGASLVLSRWKRANVLFSPALKGLKIAAGLARRRLHDSRVTAGKTAVRMVPLPDRTPKAPIDLGIADMAEKSPLPVTETGVAPAREEGLGEERPVTQGGVTKKPLSRSQRRARQRALHREESVPQPAVQIPPRRPQTAQVVRPVSAPRPGGSVGLSTPPVPQTPPRSQSAAIPAQPRPEKNGRPTPLSPPPRQRYVLGDQVVADLFSRFGRDGVPQNLLRTRTPELVGMALAVAQSRLSSQLSQFLDRHRPQFPELGAAVGSRGTVLVQGRPVEVTHLQPGPKLRGAWAARGNGTGN